MHRTLTHSSQHGRLVALALAAFALIALAGCGGTAKQEEAAAPEADTHAPVMDAATAVVTTETGTRVTLAVTEDGFVPPMVVVPAGKPVTLVVTRHTDRTCATELVMAEHGIDLKLPLNEAVEATFTPAQAETLGYACGMDMYKGKIVVQ